MGVEGEHRAGAVIEPRNNIEAPRLVLLQRDFKAIRDQHTAQELRGEELMAGRILRVDRDEVRQFALHAGDVG